MAHRVHIATDGTVLEIWSGQVTLQEWIHHESELLQHLDLSVPRQTVCDISRADLGAFDSQGVAQCLQIYQPHIEQMRDARVAIIARRGFSGNEAYVNQARQFGITVITFYERFASACRWIGTPQDEALHWRDQAVMDLAAAKPTDRRHPQRELRVSH